MIYIVIALKPEAQALVDRYTLKKTKLGKYTLHVNSKIVIIVSGIGAINSKEASLSLIQNYNIEDNDIILNIGICGASIKYTIGQLLQIDSSNDIECVSEPVSKQEYDIVDMESDGFFEATKELKHVYMYKVVSDNFEPQSVTKEKTKKLIFDNIDKIMENIKND